MDTQNPRKQIVRKRLVSEEHPELFHYTGIAALKGILESNSLWATDQRHLNDSSELTLLWPKLEEVCVAHLSKTFARYVANNPGRRDEVAAMGGPGRVAGADGATFVDIMRSLLFGTNEEPGTSIPFIASFSTHENEYHREHGMLSQWRSYGKDGVSIVFDTKELENLLRLDNEQVVFSWCGVQDAVYLERDLDFRGTFSTLFDTVELFAEHVTEGLDVHDNGVQDNMKRLYEALFPAVTRLKHFGFEEEKECRIVVGMPHHEQHDALEISENARQTKRLHHRSGRNGSIPYIRLFENLGKELPISRILVAPSRNQEANAEAVCDLVSRRNTDERILVQRSDIPYVNSN